MGDMPKNLLRKLRPDFMATAPRMLLDNMVKLDNQDDDAVVDNDPVYNLDPQGQPCRYYESTKVLGQLYRAIDETQFIKEMKDMYPSLLDYDATDATVLERAWIFVQYKAQVIQWRHLLSQARHLKAM